MRNSHENTSLIPNVSVIVPIFNTEPYLRESLNSICHQTLKEIEIILVNDGSTDGSQEIIEEYAANDSRIITFYQPNQGLSVARNSGMRLAKGEYIYFMDSDDWLEHDAMDVCYQKAIHGNVDVVLFDALSFVDGVEKCSEEIQNDYDRRKLLQSDVNQAMSAKQLFKQMIQSGAMRASACLNFIRRDLLVKNDLTFEEGLIHEDELFTPQLYALASTMMYIPRMFFHRRVRHGSIMTSVKIEKTLESLCHIISELCAFAISHFGVRWVIYLRCYELAVYANNLKKDYIKQQLPHCWKRISRCYKWFNYCRKIKKHLL